MRGEANKLECELTEFYELDDLLVLEKLITDGKLNRLEMMRDIYQSTIKDYKKNKGQLNPVLLYYINSYLYKRGYV